MKVCFLSAVKSLQNLPEKLRLMQTEPHKITPSDGPHYNSKMLANLFQKNESLPTLKSSISLHGILRDFTDREMKVEEGEWRIPTVSNKAKPQSHLLGPIES